MADYLDRLAKSRRPPRRPKLLFVIVAILVWGAAIAFLLHEMGP